MQIDWTKSLIYNQNVIVSQLHFLSKIFVSHKHNYNIVFADDFSSENQQNAISFGLGTRPTRLLGALSKRENYSTLTYDLAVPKKMLPLSKCLIIWLCWGKIMPNRWPKYNVSYFQVLVCIHLDSILRRYCGIPAKSQ